MNKRLLSWLLTGVIVANLFVSNPTFASVSFDDVPQTHTFYQFIIAISNDGIAKGFSDGTFRPDENITRGAMSKFIMLGYGFSADTNCGDFPDVPKTHTFYTEITTLKCKGIVKGTSAGTFLPDDSVTRGAATKFVIEGARVKNGDNNFLPNTCTAQFADVPINNVFNNYIYSAYCNSIVSGSNGKFFPDNYISRGAMAKILQNTRIKLGLAEPAPAPALVSENPEVKLAIDNDAKVGLLNAPIVMIVWMGTDDPYSKTLSANTLPQIFANYSDDILTVYRDMPIDGLHPNSRPEALAAECFRKVQGEDTTYTHYFTDLMDVTTNSTNLFVLTASQYNLTDAQNQSLTSCIDKKELMSEIDADIRYAEANDISGTPTTVFYSYDSKGALVKKTLSGAFPFTSFKTEIDGLLGD